MNKLFKWLLAVTGIITGLFLLLALGIYFFVDINHYKKEIEQLVKAESGLDLNIVGDLKLSVIKGVKFTTQDVAISSQQKTIADIARIELGLELRTLLNKQPVINTLTLDVRELKVKRDKQGNYNFLPTQVSPNSSSDMPVNDLSIEEIHIHIEKLLVEDEAASWVLDFNQLKASLSAFPVREQQDLLADDPRGLTQYSYEGSFKVNTLDITPGTLNHYQLSELSINFDVPVFTKAQQTDFTLAGILRHFAQKGTVKLNSKKVEYQPHEFTNIELQLVGKKERIELLPFTLNFSGAPIKGKGYLDLTNKMPEWKFQVQGKQVNMEAVSNLFGMHDAGLSGQVDVANHFAGRGLSSEFKLVDGEVDVSGRNIQIRGFDMDVIIDEFTNSQSVGLMDVGAYALLGPAGMLVNKGNDYLQLTSSVEAKGSSHISQIRTHLRIRQSIVRMEDVALATTKHRLAFKGEVDLKQRSFKNFLVATVDEKGCALYEESITGTFDVPRAQEVNLLVKGVINPITSVLSTVTDPILGRCKTPFYSGSVKSP